MDALRKLPLFVRIGLMWWVVLLAWPWSRPFVFFASPFAGGDWTRSDRVTADAPIAMAAAAGSLAYAIVAAWVIVHLLKLIAPAPSWRSRIARGAGVAWLAVGGWTFCLLAWDILRGDLDLLERFARIAWSCIFSLLGAPMFAFTAFWQATWILFPLGVLSVLIVDRVTVHAEVQTAA